MKRVIFISYFKHQFVLFKKICEKLNLKYDAILLNRGKTVLFSLLLFGVSKKHKIDNNKLKNIYSYGNEKLKIKKKLIPDNIFIVLLKISSYLLYNYYMNYFNKKKPEIVIVWNGHRMIAAAAVMAAEHLNINMLFFENGFFPNTVVIDKKGVNAKSSLSTLNKRFYEKVVINKKLLSILKEEGIRKRELRKSKNMSVDTEEVKLPEKFVFLPFQVHDDTQILLNSPYIENMEQFLDVAYKTITEYNKINHTEIFLVVKEHPSDNGKIDYTYLKEKYANEMVIFLKTYNTDKLIQNSLCVMTINSSVGIEAIFRHKKVITLGDAFFNIEGIVEHANNKEELYSKFQNLIKKDIDTELMDKFIFYLRYEYLVEYDTTKDDLDCIMNRMYEHLDQI